MAERGEVMEDQAVRDASPGYSVAAGTISAEELPPGCKRTEVGVIPEDWSIKTVNEFGQVITGGTPSTKVRAYWGDAYPWVTPTDISTNKDIRSTERHLSKAGFSVMRGLPANTVLVTCIASIGKNAVLRTPGSCNQQINAVIPDRDYDSDFLYYLFEFSKSYLIGSAGTTATSIISKSLFNSLVFAVPAIREQRAIATSLSDADALIESLDRLIAKKRAIKQATMQQLLTGQTRLPGFTGEWEVKRLGELVSEVRNGAVYKPVQRDGVAITRIETISDGKVDLSRVGYTNPYPGLDQYRLKAGDILYSHINSIEHVGKVAVFRGPMELYHGMNLLMLRPSEFVDSAWLYYVLCSSAARQWARMSAKQAVSQASINTRELRTFGIATPQKCEQTAIATVLSDMDTEIEALEHRREKARQIKQGMMQQLLTGRVRLVEPESPAEAKA